MTPEAIAFAHRALVAARLSGLLAGRLEGLAVRACSLATASPEPRDLVVAVDAAAIDGGALDDALASASASVRERGAFALVVASSTAAALVSGAVAPARAPRPEEAWLRARAWASLRRGVAIAPPVAPERLVKIAASAEKAGLVVVEGEIAPAVRAAFPSPLDRAVFAVTARGALARPILFVPRARAPKNALLRPRVDRLADGWVRATSAIAEDVAPKAPLEAAAVEVLRARGDALTFAELLRAARDAWVEGARSRGERATPSAADAGVVASLLHRLEAGDRVALFAVDPAAPGWTIDGDLGRPSEAHQEA
jgi:hypothetical protein